MRYIVLFACMVTVVYCYTFRIEPKGNKASDGSCNLDGRIIQNGETYDSEDPCVSYECNRGFINGRGCSPLFVGPPCRLVDGKGTYPNCCKQVECDSDDDSDGDDDAEK